MPDLSADPHTRSAQLLFNTESPSRTERHVAKCLNLLAARNELTAQKLGDIVSSVGYDYSLLILAYRQYVLGITEDFSISPFTEPDSCEHSTNTEVLNRVIDAIQSELGELGLSSDETSSKIRDSLERIVKRLRGVLPSQI